ncbi:circadian locomoter output cycles protein kaput-like isoform X2 [Malaya genurostris]|uniref:circadian locomoter output cycles protein kaput-like isoform X2 n=1 Tax=Malaya genurostris TaxID=325434 RepID=UPI0026F3B912|nr:circadian locomoter output cycles protein kaput-like isoform X2 [Malaya genurostris]XP_058458402.1 circadian locomoter output cycles protein kaput-like isoform X2 [Malaya genurostris]XP_058458403.1 circadian locomoter output cycles protein kaput-like isoform X2 [Malaya genurostris]
MMKEEPNIKPSAAAALGGTASFQRQTQPTAHQRQPRTISTTSYDSESDDNTQQGSSSSGNGRKDSDGEQRTDAGGSNSASKYEYDDSKTACKILNGREARNRAEKNRRDKLNGSIQELSGIVPHVAESPRRVDKTAVLRFSAHALRVDYVFGKSPPDPVNVVKQEVQDSLFRMLNGFLLTVTCRGQIVLVSASVEQFLGHCQTDLYGQNLFNLIHPDDHNLLKQQLVPSNLTNLFDSPATTSTAPVAPHPATPVDGNDELHRRSQEEEDEIDRKLRQDRRKFSIRIARAGPRSEPTAYELVTIDGCFRRADAAPRGIKPNGPSGLQLLRRARGRDDGIALHSVNGNDIVLVAMARVTKVPTICDRLIEACKYEYKTRHLIDGRIVQCDHRISVVAGYMTNEVSGLSPFTFMHKDDVRWVIVALRQMYDYNQKDGESCYRLMTRTGDFIYLKTRGYLEVDDTTKVVQSFVCINTLVSEEEGRRLVREMKRKFSVIVDQEELPDESDEPSVENPQQIERAVMNLITNLHAVENEPSDGPPMSFPQSPTVEAAGKSSLAIIAPKPSQVKSAIVKSMNVIAIASKKMSENGNDSPARDECSTTKKDRREPENITSAETQRPSVLHKVQNQSPVPESRVPPLPNSEHYFTQPFSPASTTSSSSSSCSNSVLSPASHQPFQRNSRSPFGGSVPPTSPPAIATTSASYSRIANLDNTASGHTRTTSVLKRTYSNNSISSNYDDAGNTLEYIELKRCKASPSDLSACLNNLINPASDLTTMLPNALDAVDRSLLKIESTTAIMREQVSGYGNLQHSQQRLDRIVEEQQEQREILQSIQQEYTYQIQSHGGSNDGPRGVLIEPDANNDIERLNGATASNSTMATRELAMVTDRTPAVADRGSNRTVGQYFHSSVNSPVEPTTCPTTTTSVITTAGRSMATAGMFQRGTDLNSS